MKKLCEFNQTMRENKNEQKIFGMHMLWLGPTQ